MNRPRFPLLNGPTPCQLAPRLREALGGPTRSPKILIKRDDLAGPFLGGNKSRKLEYVVADALAKGAKTLVTVGGVQSNHARMTAASARLAGLECHLILNTTSAAADPQGNLLLDELLDAKIHIVAPGPPNGPNPHEEAMVARVMKEVEAAGGKPYYVALGASVPLGVLGYVDAMAELNTQVASMGEKPTRLYYTAGSRGTQAGVVLGTRIHKSSWVPHGIAISSGDPGKTLEGIDLAEKAAVLLGLEMKFKPDEFITHQQYYGTGYAAPTAAADDAIRLVARTEAIVLDPVYTGKAMSGMIDHIRQGQIDPSETVVFLHTGGIPGLFALGTRLGVRPT